MPHPAPVRTVQRVHLLGQQVRLATVDIWVRAGSAAERHLVVSARPAVAVGEGREDVDYATLGCCVQGAGRGVAGPLLAL